MRRPPWTSVAQGARWSWCLWAVLLATAVPRASDGQEIFDLQADIDVPVIALSFGIGGVPELFQSQLPPPACWPDCDPASVPAFDRWSIGMSSRAAAWISDVLVLAIPFAGLAVDYADEQGTAFWQDAAVVLEAYAVSTLLVGITKLAMRRPRPYVYDPTLPPELRRSPDAALSLYSGHTAMSFVGVTAFGEVFRRRHDGAAVAAYYATGLTLASLVGLCRILSGKHYLTDVLVGAVVGISVGVLVPALHARSPERP